MKTCNFVVDVEADGPAPGLYSMVSFGVVNVEDLKQRFYGETAPISNNWISEALAVSGVSREVHKTFMSPSRTMYYFQQWISCFDGRKVFWSDNLAFDWQFINYYCHLCLRDNPFGYSGRRIGDLYAGLTKKVWNHTNWKKMRKTQHDHNPVNDALGNAEVLKNLLYTT